MNIEYIETNEHCSELTESMNQKLVDYHQERSEHFASHFAAMSVSGGALARLEKAVEGGIRIDLAKDRDTGELVGYCISTISKSEQGEIDSIFVEPEYRGSGIGGELMEKALSWMDERSIIKRVLSVGAGNEEVFTFYSRYNFYPRTIILEQVNE